MNICNLVVIIDTIIVNLRQDISLDDSYLFESPIIFVSIRFDKRNFTESQCNKVNVLKSP
jgi:hypothetical protein